MFQIIPNPVAFTIFGIDIRWYAITMITGILAGIFLALSRKKAFSLSNDDILDYCLWVIPISIIGARIYYVIFEWDQYVNNPIEIIMIRHGGLAIHGAIIFGIITTYFYTKYKKYNFLKFLDLMTPSLALGQAIGRWGNYFNSEAHGIETDVFWAIPVRQDGEIIHVHPTFLYESIWDLLLCLFLLYYERKFERKCGEGTCLYLVFYGIGRFFVEGLRTDSLMFLGLRQAQLISIGFILVGLLGFIYLKKYGKAFELS